MYYTASLTPVPPSTQVPLEKGKTYTTSEQGKSEPVLNISDGDAGIFIDNPNDTLRPIYGNETTANKVKAESGSVKEADYKKTQDGDGYYVLNNAKNPNAVGDRVREQLEYMKKQYTSYYEAKNMADVIQNSLDANPDYAGCIVKVMPVINAKPGEACHQLAIYGPNYNNITDNVMAAYYDAIERQGIVANEP